MLGPNNRRVWQPWSSTSPPQIALLAGLSPDSPVCALLGASGTGERGRFGLFAEPTEVRRMTPGPGAIARAVDDRPPEGIRVLVLGYELGAPEVHLAPDRPPRGQPAGMIMDCPAGVLVDHQLRQWTRFGDPIEQTTLPSSDPLARHPLATSGGSRGWSPSPRLEPAVSDDEHQRRIRCALRLIEAGEIYQANLSRRLRVGPDLDPVAGLSALHDLNPVAHSALIRADGIELLSNSMETLLRFDPGTRRAESFPIKGTRARLPGDQSGDARLATDAKERAEHIMIVDLVRNDLGRVCAPGSVKVPELLETHGFCGVWHGISTVRGILADSHTPGELLAALFPGGSITGAPKRRSMEVIQELEGEPRGFYTGSIVWLMPEGWLSASILIRTLVRDEYGWSLSVGGGIVADSQPEREVRETWEKIAVFDQLLAQGAATSVSASPPGSSSWRPSRRCRPAAP